MARTPAPAPQPRPDQADAAAIDHAPPRRRWPRTLAIVGGVALLAVLGLAAHTWWGRPLSIDWFFTRVEAQRLLDEPETLTTLRLLEPYGLRGHNGRLQDLSAAAEARRAGWARDALATLRGYDRAALPPAQQVDYDVLEFELRMDVAAEPFRYHGFPINQTDGMQTSLPDFMVVYQQVHDVEDAENYLRRLEAFPRRYADVLAQLRAADARHIRPPRFMVDAVLAQLRAMAAQRPEQDTLYINLRDKLSAAAREPGSGLDARTRANLLARAASTLRTHVYPAYGELVRWFAAQQPHLARNDGAWALPDGARYYAYCIEENTGTTLTADQLHALGLSEVARIGARMDTLLRTLGYTDGTLGARMRALAATPEQRWPDTAAGRAAMLAEYRRLVQQAMPVLARQFARLPRAKLEVRPVPRYAEATAPGAYYYDPALDGSTPGVFYVNLRDVRDLPRFTMPTLTYHEAVPGHHFQIALAQETPGLRLFRRTAFFNAYLEGWALYAEQLAGELGLEPAPTDELGRLQSEMFRAVRLVVDTGMHAKRWSRERAIAYMIDETGMGDTEVSAEIERYLVDPGQALGYKVGMLRILALREGARRQLGARFDIREFHSAVLGHGVVPLGVLDRLVADYVARARAAQPRARTGGA